MLLVSIVKEVGVGMRRQEAGGRKWEVVEIAFWRRPRE
jgi:hypothetical protein